MQIRILFLLLVFLLVHCERTGQEDSPTDPKNPTTGRDRMAGDGSFSGKGEGIVIQENHASRSDAAPAGKRRSRKKAMPPAGTTLTGIPDSLRREQIRFLRMNSVEPDLNEPVSREYILNPVGNPAYASLITLSRESFLKINFDNDILNNTDMYYTNGFRFDLILPLFQKFPLSRLMVPYWGTGINYYGISLIQNMYTPSTTKVGGIPEGDRPYAAYLCLGIFKITNDLVHRFRQSSELDIGVLGPSSFGEFVQKSFHNSTPTNNEPLGWEYQIQNDLVLNYAVTFEKGIVSRPHFELNLLGTGMLGTLYTHIEGGLHMRAGLINPYFCNLGLSKRAKTQEMGLKSTQVYFTLKSSGRLVGYDATLQGGMFNQSSPYVIGSSEISRFMMESSAGLSLVHRGIRFDAEQFILSPEFHHGKWHLWMHFGITFCL